MPEAINSTCVANLKGTVTNFSNGRIGVESIVVTNASGATAYVQVFNLAAADVSLATTVPLVVIACATGATEQLISSSEWVFDTRLSMASTTTPTGSTASADGVFVQVFIN